MLRFFDRLLTFFIDQLYLMRTKLRIRAAVQEAETAGQYNYPLNSEVIDRRLGEFGLSIQSLSETGAHKCAANVDAALKI